MDGLIKYQFEHDPIRKCKQCPCKEWDEEEALFYCELGDFICSENGIHEDCPLVEVENGK